MTSNQTIDQFAINTLRALAVDMIQKANSGHPGLPLGAAPMAYILWQRHLRHNPGDPSWPDRDRFILSAGHGSALLYSLLHLTGYKVGIEDLQRFRQWGSLTPGHPEFRHTPGVEATTGPLGQGVANAVGMAAAEAAMAAAYNRPGYPIVDHYTYALAGDGDLMEGVAVEAAAVAGHLKLGKLLVLYDANNVTLDGPLSLCNAAEDTAAKYTAMGWQVLTVADGDTDLAAIDKAIADAIAETAMPSLLIVKTTIGYGSPSKAGTSACHGSPLGVEEVRRTKEALDCDPDQHFAVPAAVAAHMGRAVDHGRMQQESWRKMAEAWAREYPELALQFRQSIAGEPPDGFDAALPTFAPGTAVSTRKASGMAINALAATVPWLLGGDADLSVSTTTAIKGGGDFTSATPAGRNLHYGIREHAMTAIANGMLYHGGVRPFVSTFFVFSDYMRPALRMAALAQLPLIAVWTHDSLAVGEDGPTHQPVEHLAALRAMPGFTLIRPADAAEAVEAWRTAMRHTHGPVGLVMSRQDLPVLDRGRYASAAGSARGGYILSEAVGGAPRALIIATGSEVHLALAAQDQLAAKGVPVRVVSLPSWELFAAQGDDYRQTVLPPAVTARVAVEAGVSMGWERFVGCKGKIIAIDRFGASAPGDEVLRRKGFTVEAVLRAVESLL